MAKIEFPKLLRELLEDSDLQAPIRVFADRVGEILADNKLPFFPDYTDHGIDHVNCVLKSEVELVPKQVWEDSKRDSNPRLLCDADAVVIIGATLLHDFAMHLRPDGFKELVSKGSKFQPLPWFRENHEGHSADRPWVDLWEDYTREARRFSDRQLTNIIGEESATIWKFYDLPDDAGQWERNHCLIIGEFIRRHHARLAHEIAIYGFPGLPVGLGDGQFPALGKEEGQTLMRLADLIGLTARSHWMSLRVCKAYLDSSPLYPGTPRPMGTAVLYPMSLLRVADYFQIDRQRAPAVLLQLRNPQSPISVQEWKKHRAVQQIGPANDPRGKLVTVTTDLSLSLYIQLRDLLSGLQAEMDHSTAVLDEAYGTLIELGLHQLNLVTRRVYSNLQSPAFRDSLPYVPNQTGFTADPNLLTLLVEPLYGKQPSVGVRELMQNAADAVRELEAWCQIHGVNIEALDLPEQDGDVLVEFIKRENGTWFLRVRDRGIGMRSDTIQNYFLRAGASFRRSAEWAKEFLDEKGHPRVIRAGRFGIGAFAVFLLGPSFRLSTRHASADDSMGYSIEASATSQLIELRRVHGLPVGTSIEVEVSSDSVKALELEEEEYSNYDGPERLIDWFCWDWPEISKRVVRGPQPEALLQKYVCPVRNSKLPPEWSIIQPEGFDAVYWTFNTKTQPSISCNGLRIADPSYMSDSGYFWPEETTQLRRPCIAILDNVANLPLTIQRYRLSQNTPFVDELARDVLLSFIAHALVCGPTSQADAISGGRRHPLSLGLFLRYDERRVRRSPFTRGLLRWCTTSKGMVPIDPWLYTLLKAESCLVYGSLSFDSPNSRLHSLLEPSLLEQVCSMGEAVLGWFGKMQTSTSSRVRIRNSYKHIFGVLVEEGISVLGPMVAARVICDSPKFNFNSARQTRALESSHKSLSWEEVHASGRRFFEAENGSLQSSLPLRSVVEEMESDSDGILFAAEIRTGLVESPESLIAKIWQECLGANAIPFDPAHREALTAQGKKHPELKRHIEAWQELKSNGSGWVTGSFRLEDRPGISTQEFMP
jgi:molecular chaperone HtpG